VAIVCLLGGCSATSSTQPKSELRGFASNTPGCHEGLDNSSEVVIPGKPTQLVVCGGRHHRMVALKTLTPNDGPAFNALVAALSLPDVPAGDECGDIAGPMPIMVSTRHGSWTVAIPGDGCDRLRQEVKDALAAAHVPPQFPRF